MEFPRIFLSVFIALTLFSYGVDYHRFVEIFSLDHHIDEVCYVMSVHRTEICKAQLFKEHAAVVHYGIFDVVFYIGKTCGQRASEA